MFKQIFEIFKSDSLYEQALVECHEMLDIDLTMFKASIHSFRKSEEVQLVKLGQQQEYKPLCRKCFNKAK